MSSWWSLPWIVSQGIWIVSQGMRNNLDLWMLNWMISHMMVINGGDTGLNFHLTTITSTTIHWTTTTTTNNTKSIGRIKTHHVGYSLLLTCALFKCNGIVSIWCYWVFWWFCFERRNLILDTVEETLFLHSTDYFSIVATESTDFVVLLL